MTDIAAPLHGTTDFGKADKPKLDTPPNPLALILFYAALITLGGLSFHYFERPMQNFLRGVLGKKSPAPEN